MFELPCEMYKSYENTKKRCLPPDFLCADRVVSYIHDEDLINEMQKIPKIGHRASITSIPVSYTHLDVYKRQPVMSDKYSCI